MAEILGKNVNSITSPQLTETQKKVDKQFKDVGSLYEKQFLREMMKQMRATVPEGGLIQQSMGEKIFQEQLDQEYVEKWGDVGGIGLGDMIYKSLLDKFGARFGLLADREKISGPLPLDAKSDYRVNRSQTQSGLSALDMQFSRSGQAGKLIKPQEILSPWKGTVTGVWDLAHGQKLVEIEHSKGIKSQLLFKGALSTEIGMGKEISAGERVAVLDPDASNFAWKVKQPAQDPGPVLAE